MLNESKIALKDAFVNTHPLLWLHWTVLHLGTSLHNVSHLTDWDHSEATTVDSTDAASKLLNMR